MSFYYGMKCPFCDDLVLQGQQLCGFNGEWGPGHRWRQLHMMFIHQRCYLLWDERDAFAAEQFERWVRNERESLDLHRAYLDEQLLVMLSGDVDELRGEVVMVSRELGFPLRVGQTEYEMWLKMLEPDDGPRGKSGPMSRVRGILSIHAPNIDRLLAGVDRDHKRTLRAQLQEQSRQEGIADRERNRMNTTHNAACKKLIERIRQEGLLCPHCGEYSRDYVRLTSKLRSSVVCEKCGGVVSAKS